MAGITRARFESSTDVRHFADGKGQMHTLDIDGMAVGRAVFEPGWQWSQHVKPIAGTDSCQAPHAGYILSGHMTVRVDDGTVQNFDPGDCAGPPTSTNALVSREARGCRRTPARRGATSPPGSA